MCNKWLSLTIIIVFIGLVATILFFIFTQIQEIVNCTEYVLEDCNSCESQSSEMETEIYNGNSERIVAELWQWMGSFNFDLMETYTIYQIERIYLFEELVGKLICDIEDYGFVLEDEGLNLPIMINFNGNIANLFLINYTAYIEQTSGDHTLSQLFVVSEDGIIQTMLPPRRNLADWYTILGVYYEDINGDDVNEIIVHTVTISQWGGINEWYNFYFYFYEDGTFTEHIELSNQVTFVADAMSIFPYPRREPSLLELYFSPSLEYMLDYARQLFMR